ncbi:spermatogenesis-associated protein 20, partial [Rhizophlyctis rosea]
MNVPASTFSSLPTATPGRLKHLADFYGLDLKFGAEVGGLEGEEAKEAVERGLKVRKGQSGKALDMVDFTLKQIARGGIHDHVGLGFHRYSVDKHWHVPHFEKMLYDQAQLCAAYLDAYQCTKDEFHAEIVRDIIQYVERDLLSPEGGFYSAEDADSYPVEGAKEKKEGAFAVWEREEILSAVGEEDASVFCSHFGVKPSGNVNPRNDPHGELTDKNVLIQRETLEETARRFDRSVEEIRGVLERVKAKLWEVRKGRPKPHRDDKVITSWNGLMISAIARAHQVLVLGKDPKSEDKHYLELATRAAEFFYERMWDRGRKVLKRSFREGAGDVEGFADDYAFLVQGLLDLYEANFEERWLEWAVELQETQDKLFWD